MVVCYESSTYDQTKQHLKNKIDFHIATERDTIYKIKTSLLQQQQNDDDDDSVKRFPLTNKKKRFK